ncbi:MAG: carbohydrate kinase [Cyanobacteria bacterium J06623_4]
MNHAICLGEILIDCFSEQPGVAWGDVTRWLPLPGGAPANVACALAKLGNTVEFVGAVGEDAWGDALLQLLDDMQVGRRGVQRRKKAPTRQVYITHDEHGDRTFAGFGERDPSLFADAHLFVSALESSLFAEASFLVLGTLSLAYADTRESVMQAVQQARSYHLPILVDVNWRPMFWPKPAEAPRIIYDLIRQVHFLKVSEEEADWLFGTVSVRAIARQLPHLKGVLVTAGAQGAHYCFGDIAGNIPGFRVDVEETTGAGDAFTAGFVHQLLQRGLHCLQDADLAKQVVTYANATGALTTTRMGAIAALPTPSEIEVFLYLNTPAENSLDQLPK